jgi:hypothetical protein
LFLHRFRRCADERPLYSISPPSIYSPVISMSHPGTVYGSLKTPQMVFSNCFRSRADERPMIRSRLLPLERTTDSRSAHATFAHCHGSAASRPAAQARPLSGIQCAGRAHVKPICLQHPCDSPPRERERTLCLCAGERARRCGNEYSQRSGRMVCLISSSFQMLY